MKRFIYLSFFSSVFFLNATFGQISLTGSYSQNFDSYSGSAGSVPAGWSIFTTGTFSFVGLDNGTATNYGAYGYTINSLDVSFGFLPQLNKTGNFTISVSFVNNTSNPITELTLNWNYEQYHYRNADGFDVTATGVLDTSVLINSQDFIANIRGTDGQVTSTPVSVTLTNLNIQNGETFGLMWTTTGVENGNDKNSGIAIDDFQLTGSPPLPVELSSFTAALLNKSIHLNWRTETEVMNYGFEIQRAVTPQDIYPEIAQFKTIDFIPGYGNSNVPHEYSYIDKDLKISGKYIYRLKQIDTDGKYEYSDPVDLVFTNGSGYQLGQNYPNPFNPVTTISFIIPQKSFVSLKVYDVLGNEIETLINKDLEGGEHAVNFKPGNLPSGLYIYSITAGSFKEVKKMLYLK
jgi:Secretion system C-terminal sorting domain